MGSNVTINAPASIVELETNLCEDCSFTIIEKAPIRTFSVCLAVFVIVKLQSLQRFDSSSNPQMWEEMHSIITLTEGTGHSC